MQGIDLEEVQTSPGEQAVADPPWEAKSLSLCPGVYKSLPGGSPFPSKAESKEDLQKKPHAKGNY